MEQSPFMKFLGNGSNIRILNYLIKYRGLDYSMSDIARNSNVGWATLSRLWQEFVKYRNKKLLLQETENYFTKKVKVKA